MALLRTCKQVYDEACLVPYYDNAFSFASGKDLDVFVNAVLQPKQHEALSHVRYTVDTRVMTSDKRGFSIGIEPAYVMKKYVDNRILSGLQPSTVDLLVGLQSIDIALESDHHSYRFDENLPRFLKMDISIRVVVGDGWHANGRQWGAAMKLQYGLSRSVADVRDEREASRQLQEIDSWTALLLARNGCIWPINTRTSRFPVPSNDTRVRP